MDKFDPVTMDLAQEHPEYPSALIPFSFESHGQPLLARFLLASGKGPHPVAVLCHGFPGNEPNFDLAHVLRRAGWNVLFFHYRGAWGSGGQFAFSNCVEDGLSVVDFVHSERASTEFRCDPRQLVFFGHSMGGFVSLHTAAADRRVSAVATIAAFNFGAFGKWMLDHPERIELATEMFQNSSRPVQGATGEGLIQEVLRNHERWDLETLADPIRKTPLLLMYGDRDEVSVPEAHHHPLMRAFSAHRVASLQERRFATDHMFIQVRIAMMREVLAWLGTL